MLIQYRIARDPKGKRKQNIGEKQKIDPQIHSKSLPYGVEKACRENRRLRSEAQLSLRSKSSVEWPRYKERDASLVLAWRAASLLLVGLLFVLKPHMRDDG